MRCLLTCMCVTGKRRISHLLEEYVVIKVRPVDREIFIVEIFLYPRKRKKIDLKISASLLVKESNILLGTKFDCMQAKFLAVKFLS